MQSYRSLPLLLAGLSPSLQAQDAPAAGEDIYELVTTAVHVRRSETALPVTVLTGDELRGAARATLGDTLANQPGISNASFGPAVGQTVIRGQQGRRVLNMTNGIPNADASGNSADHALSVEPILADTIEVLRGPSTLLYGGGAIGGVVNVIDNRIAQRLPAAPALSLEARHDTAADQNNLVGRLEFATGRVAWHFDALRREWNDLEIPGSAIDPAYLEDDADHGEEEGEQEAIENTRGFVANTGGETEAATAGLSWVLGDGYLGFSASRLDNAYGLPPAVHGLEEHEGEEPGAEQEHGEAEFVMIDMQRTRYDLAAEWRNPHALVETLRYKLSVSDYAHRELEGPGIVGTRFDNDSVQQRLQLVHPEFGGWHGVLGWQSTREEFGAIGEESFIPLTDTVSNGLFLVEDYHLDSVTFEFGARLNRDELDAGAAGLGSRAFTTHSLSASALWDLNATLTLGLTWSQSQRPPSVEELYSNHRMEDPEACVIHFATGACEIGDAGFSEETSRNADLSLYLDYGRFNATVTVFHNDFSDYIFQADSGMETNGFPIRHYRQSDATFRGVEVDAGFALNGMLELRVFGDAIESDIDGYGDAPRMPPARLGSRLTASGGQWEAFVSVLRAAAQDEPGPNELPTAGYTRWDIGANYRFNTGASGELTLFAKGRNLMDEEIRLSTSYLRGFAPEAGRSLELGVRYQF